MLRSGKVTAPKGVKLGCPHKCNGFVTLQQLDLDALAGQEASRGR